MSSLHQHAKDVFLEALGRPAGERAAFVADVCGTDAALRQEVESLLAFHSDQSAPSDQTGDPPRSLSERASQPRTESTLPFVPGAVFAGRYRMITRIGRGGMGDVWRADDLVLETPVALKLIQRSSPNARERILNEVRLARQITHPAVCRVFDVGESDGQVFYTMEVVDGEDLATLRRRVGRLSSEKVIEIARQLCAGLAAAHSQGVLHRDLKPANVLIDDDGRVRITDFGIAITQTDEPRRSLTGTPGYMAPEQEALGLSLSERTDVYALGLVLYELVVGHHPFNRTSATAAPSRPSTLVHGVNPQLERVIMQALARDPRDRPQSALEMAASLPSGTAGTSRRRFGGWAIGAAVTAAVVAVALVASFFVVRGSHGLTAQDTVVLADFSNTTGEPVFDGALKVALAVALEQSPFLKVFPDESVRDTLRLMGRSPDVPVTRTIAREIAQREQLKALMAGSIAGLGRNYVVALEAINAATGDVMAREQVEVSSKEEVLTALGGIAAKLREKLGESLASVQKFDTPLARATTSSLDALQSYSLALDQGTVNPRVGAIPHLKRAIELDPNFALALAFLATVYSNNGQTALAPEYAAKAFALRDRVSERERFFVSFRYYRDATQDWDKALELTRLWTATYPRESFAFNSLGNALSRFGQNEAAIEPFREAIRLEPKFLAPYPNLAGVLMALNRFDDVDAVFKQAAAAKLDSFSLRRLSYQKAFLTRDAAAMARNFEAAIAMDATGAAHGWEAHVSAVRGQFAEAHDRFRRGIRLALQGGFTEVAAQLSVEDAEIHVLAGDCAAARPEIAEGLDLSRDNYTLERASRSLAMCGVDADVTALTRELGERFRNATLTTRIALPMTAAATAMRRGQAARALEILDSVRPYDQAPKSEFWPAYVRGEAYLQLKDAPAAAVEFQSVLDHRGVYPNAPLYPFAQLGAARAAALAGETEKARQLYAALFTTWSGADPGVAPVRSAQAEAGRLR